MFIYGDSIFSINESLFKGGMNQVNKELIDKIDGKYPWYFINITELKGILKTETKITLYGFDEEPKHGKNEGIINGISNQKIVHQLYEKTINGYHNKNELDSNLRRYTTYNKGASYKNKGE